MDKNKIKFAAYEAVRFLKMVDELKSAQKTNPWFCPKESGAVRRSSMDLTRALAKMRKP